MVYVKLNDETVNAMQSFDSVEEMNEAVKFYKEKFELGATDVAILDAISRYACKIPGVCYLRKQGIAEDAGFKSKRTAIRACLRLEELGVIKQFATRRVAGDKRQSANIIVIQAIEGEAPKQVEKTTESPQQVTPESHTKEAFSQSLPKTNTLKDTMLDTENRLKKSLRSSMPTEIFDALSPFFNAKGIYETYGILLRAKAKADFRLEDYVEQFVEGFDRAVRLYKWGKVQNLNNYLFTTWQQLTKLINGQQIFGMI